MIPGPDVLLLTDADNTLWDTDKVYATAQVGMLREVAGLLGASVPEADDQALAQVRAVDQGLAHTHPSGLRYPPTLLARALAAAFADGFGAREHGSKAAFSGEDRIVARFVGMLGAVPALRPGVLEAVPELARQGIPIIVATEGELARCERLLAHHRLSEHVRHVVEGRKSVAFYRRMLADFPARRSLMVGDQVDRDVADASEAGFETYHFPGGFDPFWTSGVRAPATATIADYRDLLRVVRPARGRRPPDPPRTLGTRVA